MTTRSKAPLGAPCWVDLWTSDVEGSRKFYSEVFGWQAQEPSPEFGGYFMFTRSDIPVAGGMGDMGDMKADNSWKIYFDTPDMASTLEAAVTNGATVMLPAMPVADLGIQAVLRDSGGASLGAWQAQSFAGFTVVEEHGAPSWFELHTRDHGRAVEFYRRVFKWETSTMSDTDEFRYTTSSDASGEDLLSGIMDARSFMPEGAPDQWSIYWYVDDTNEAVATAEALGGSVVTKPEDTPFGRLTTLKDPSGAHFKLRTSID